LAQALLPGPELVLLDEPTSALDPFGRMLVRGVIRDLRAQGTTVFLNSHLLSEVEATCDRVAFLREGRVLQTLSLNDIQAEHLTVDIEVDSASDELINSLRRDAISLRILGDETNRDPSSRMRIEMTVADDDGLPQVAARLVAGGARLYSLTPRRMSLEELFLKVVGSEDSGQ
jgi:ABC-2 type transport system ATP-binding protein